MPALFITFVAILCLGGFVLYYDGKTKLVDRQLAVIMPARSEAAPTISPRRILAQNDFRLNHLLRLVLRYRPDTPHRMVITIISLMIAITAAVIGAMLVPLWAAALISVGVWMVALRSLFGGQQERYADKLVRQLPDTLELVISAVRAGLPVAEAFRAAAREMPDPTREQFTVVVNDMALGRPIDEALLDVFYRTRVAEYAMFSVTLGIQGKAGGRLAETLRTLADAVRQRVALAGRAKALSAETRLSSLILACLPFVSGIIMYLQRPENIMLLFTDPRGRIMFAYGMISLTLGTLIMRRMVRKGTTV